MLSLRGARSGLRTIHNGKGRPPLALPSSRQYSQLLVRGKARSLLSPTSRIRLVQLPLASSLLQSYRHASSTSIPTPPPAATAGPATPGATSSSEWEALIQEVSDTHALQVEPHLGWLKELGLDYGWGPTAMMETVLEAVQLYSGLPWWASILATTYAVRILLVKLFVTSSDHAARMAMLGETLKPAQDRMREARLAKDNEAVRVATLELRAVYAAAGVKMRKIVTPMLLQGILGFGLFRLVAGMSRHPVPGMESGGILWFKDLTMADPTYALPLLSGAIMYWVLKRGGDNGQMNINPNTWKTLTYVLPGATTLIFFNLPAGMQFLACITATWSSAQSMILRWAPFRRFCGITPLPPPKVRTSSTERYQGTVTAYRAPDEIAKSNSIGGKFRSAKSTMSTYVKKNVPTQTVTRLNARDREKAQQYEKERRAEIDAAREKYLKKHGQKKK